MRVLLLTLLVVAGTQANFLTDIGDAFKTTFDSLLDQSKEVGSQLLDELKVTGATLASQGLQALMLNVADSLTNKDTTTAAPQKRQLDGGLQSVEDPNGVIYGHADELKQYMQTALGAASHMDHPENYQQPIQDFLDLIDRVVASHEGTTTAKRQLSNLNLAPLTSLEGVVMSHANELKSYMQTAVAALNGLSSMVDQPQTLTMLKTFLGQVDQVIADHNTSVDAVVAKLAQEVTSLMPASGNKRSLSDSINAIGQGLTQMFQPNAIAVKSLVASMGDILKNAATQLFSSMVASATHLGSDASPVQTLVKEGETMGVSTLKNTLGNIMQQVLGNMEPHLANLAGELLHQ